MTDKSPDAYRTISEVAEDLDLPQHVLRFWETRFSQIRPLKRGGGRRYYRPDDVELLKGIRYLLYSEGYTIKGVQRILKEQGPKAVQMAVQGDGGGEGAVSHGAALPPHLEALDDEADELADDLSDEPSDEPAPHVAPAVQSHAPEPPRRPASLESAPPPRPAPEPDLFGGGVVAPPPERAPTPPPPERAPPPPPPPAPVPAKPMAPANVAFMRGVLHKPVVPAQTPPASNVLVRRPPPTPEPPSPRFAPVFEAEPEPPRAPPRVEPVARRDGLTPEQRRALQSALFELSECRRMIETVSATRAR